MYIVIQSGRISSFNLHLMSLWLTVLKCIISFSASENYMDRGTDCPHPTGDIKVCVIFIMKLDLCQEHQCVCT